MEYFILEVSKEYIPPSLDGWYGVLDKRTLKNKKVYEFPQHLIFMVKKHMQLVFTDILLHPCFMVSQEAKGIIQMYEPFINYARILLYDENEKQSKTYFIPFLEEVDCLDEKSRFNLDRSVIHLASIDGSRVDKRTILRVGNVNQTCILVRQDLAESLLRRKMIGIGLRETITNYNDN